MNLDILKHYGYDHPSYPTELGHDVLLVVPEEFWVVDISSSPPVRLVGPFYSLEEAKNCLARIEKEYQRLLEEEKFDLSAFKAFIERENIEIEEKIRKTRQDELKNYTPTITKPETGIKRDM